MVMLYNKDGGTKTGLEKKEAEELLQGNEWFESEKEAKEAYTLKLDAEKRDVERQKQEADRKANEERQQVENETGLTNHQYNITKPTPQNTLGKAYDVNDHTTNPADAKAQAKPVGKHGHK